MLTEWHIFILMTQVFSTGASGEHEEVLFYISQIITWLPNPPESNTLLMTSLPRCRKCSYHAH